MERIRQLLLALWEQVPTEWRAEVGGGLIVAGVGIIAASVWTGLKLLAGRLRKSVALPPAAPPPQTLPPQQVEVKVIAQPPSPPEPAAIETPMPTLSIPPPSTHAPPIPRPPTIGFVARRDKAGEEGRDIVSLLEEELAPGRNQLVTLSGPGGVGKTTLAAEAARKLRDAYGGRLVWSYTAARAGYTISALLDDIATQLGRADLRTLKPEDKESAVRALVADPSTLVVLDNCETITPDEWQRIETWFDHAQCSALFTSRQTVKRTFNVNLLVMLPDEAQDFLGRLITQTQDPQIFSDDVRQQIYTTAEANPFLMEWIVAQINEAQEPATVFRELSEGEGDAAQRVFDRSFNLPQLGDDGRAALLALSLFTPSASREALAHAAGFGDDTKRLNEAVRSLHALWLIKATDQNRRLTVEGLTRTRAAARLSKDSRADEFRQRFVAYFHRYAEARAQPTPEDYNALEAEKDNLLSATDVASSLEDRERVVQMADALAIPVTGMLSVRGYWDETLRVGDLALKAARATQAEEVIARIAHNVAVMYQYRGELDEARRLYGESLEITKKLGNQSGIGITLHQLGRLAQDAGALDEARRLYGESLEIAKKLGDQMGIASTLHELGRLAQGAGELDEARRLYGESLEIETRLGNQGGIAITLNQLGKLAYEQGKLGEARRLCRESLEIKRRLGDQMGIAISLHSLGVLAKREGNKAEAARLLREALGIYEKLGSPNADDARESLERVEGKSS